MPTHQRIALGVVDADSGMSEFQEGQGVVHGDLNTPGFDLPLTGQRSRGDPAQWHQPGLLALHRLHVPIGIEKRLVAVVEAGQVYLQGVRPDQRSSWNRSRGEAGGDLVGPFEIAFGPDPLVGHGLVRCGDRRLGEGANPSRSSSDGLAIVVGQVDQHVQAASTGPARFTGEDQVRESPEGLEPVV